MSSSKRKNGRVELLRFIFAIIILLFHINKRFGPTRLFNRGYIGVEFFFLVSGYLLAAGTYSKRNIATDDLGSETLQMIWKKIMSVFPYHLFAMVLTVMVNAYFLFSTAEDRVHYVVSSWASLFFVQIFGFDSSWANKLTWYLDVWLVVTFVFYIFLRKHYDIFIKVVCPILALFVLGYMDHEFGRLADIDVWTGLFYKCFLRGMSEMALGCSAFALTKHINETRFTAAGKIILAVLELACYGLSIAYSCSKVSYHYEFVVVFIMMMGLTLTFSKINTCEKIFSGKIYDWFGKMSLLIYLNQFYVIRLVQECFGKANFVEKTILCVVLTFACSGLCNIIVGTVMKKQPIKNLIIEKEDV